MNKLIKTKSYVICLYILIFVSILVGIEQVWFGDLLKEPNFLNWDAEHYSWIRENGYKGFRVAFFPFLPLIWKLLHVNGIGISIVNGIIFISSIYFLSREFKFKSTELLLFLTFPSGIFYFLPYTESLFFLGSFLVLIGLSKEKLLFILTGLFIATLARPSFIFFIPTIIIVQLFYLKTAGIKRTLNELALQLLTIFAGLFIVLFIQYQSTGSWSSYWELSSNSGWDSKLFSLPQLPLTSWAGGFIVRLDGVALLFGGLSGILGLLYIFKVPDLKRINKPLLFSLCYLGGVALFIFLREGNLYSLNRFIFAVPFAIIVLHHWINLELKLKRKHLLFILLAITCYWLMFGSYVHIQTMMKFLLVSLYVLLVFAIKSDCELIRKYSWLLLVFVNFSFQIIFYLRFLNGEWVG